MRVMGDSGEEGGGLFRVYCDGEVRKFWLAPFVEVYCNEGFLGGAQQIGKNSAMDFLWPALQR